MSDCEHKEPAKCSNVKWGAIIAGAAIATGAILLAPGFLGNVAHWVGSFFAAKAVEEGAKTVAAETIKKTVEVTWSETWKKIGEAMVGWTATKLYGAALIGGGAAYFMGGKSEAQHEHHHALARANRESYAMQEDMRLTQGKMIIQSAEAGNEQATALRAQMFQGRS